MRTHPISDTQDAEIRVSACPQALAMLDDLIETGLRGSTREEVALSLIYDQLKHLAARGVVSWNGK